MDESGILLEIKDGIAIVTLNRPKALNALNLAMIEEFAAVIKQLSRNKDVRALVLTGAGKAFVAGADVKDLASMRASQAFSFSRQGQQAFDRLERLDFPVIAAINGFALGGGCELALACDIRIASVTARFGMPEVSLGLMPGFGGTQRLCRAVGYANAMYLMTTAETLNAQEALHMGLVQKLTEPDVLLEEALVIASKIASRGRYAVKAVKELALKSFDADYANSAELESEVFAGLFGKPEADEGMKAFLDKRNPQW